MKNVNLAIRTAIATALNNIVYNTVKIGVFEEYVQETTNNKMGIITVGGVPVNAYIILLNQTSNDNSPKCGRNDLCSIQIQIKTEWPASKGGSKMGEEISELVYSALFTEDGKFTTLTLPNGLSLWRGVMDGTINLNYDGNSSRTWITQLILNLEVSQ